MLTKNNRRHVKISALAVSLLAGSALSQTNNFTYELRLTSPDVASNGVLIAPSVPVRFHLEARARANTLATNNVNYGVMRVFTGPAGQNPSVITISEASGQMRLLRSVVNAAGPGGFPLTGRMPLFRSGGPVDDSTSSLWHSQDSNGPAGATFPSATGNNFGTFDQGGDRLFGFDAYAGPSRSGTTNPWIGDFPTTPAGEFSPWRQVYAFEVAVPSGVEGTVVVDASAYVSAGVRANAIGGGTWLMNLTGGAPASGSVSAQYAFTISNSAPDFQVSPVATVTWPSPTGNGNTYTLFQASRPVTWIEAAAALPLSSMRFVNIASAAEQAFIDQWLVGIPGAFDAQGFGPWIGARLNAGSTDPAVNPWQWQDVGPFRYANWAAGEPDSNGSVSASAYLQRLIPGNSAWADLPAETGTLRYFIGESSSCGSPVRVLPQQPPLQIVANTQGVTNLTVDSFNAVNTQWRLNDQPIPSATGSSYLPSLSASNPGGFYDAVVTGACGGEVISSGAAVSLCSPLLNPWSASSLQARLEHQIAWDSTSKRFIAFGGTLGASMSVHFADTLELVGQTWRPVPVVGPSGRFDHAMCEAPGGGIVLFGGRGVNGQVSNETWVYRDGAWQLVAVPTGARPAARGGHEMVFDVQRNRVVMFGGFGPGPTFTNLGDTWEFDGTTWTQVTGGVSPSPRFGHAMGYDKSRNLIVLHGGLDAQRLGDTWTYGPLGWSEVGGFGPSPRLGASMHFDAIRNAVVMVGGSTNTQSATDQQWSFAASGWTQLTTPFIGQAVWAHDAASAPSGQVVLAGGARGTSPLNPVAATWSGPSQPVIGTQPPTQTAFLPNGAVQIAVDAFGHNLTYRWQRNGVPLNDGAQPFPATYTIAGATTPVLTINSANAGAVGEYRVQVSGPCGSLNLLSDATNLVQQCGLSDIGSAGGAATPDGRLDNNDFIVFVNWYFDADSRADVGSEGGAEGSDGIIDANDFVVFVQRFFVGCE